MCMNSTLLLMVLSEGFHIYCKKNFIFFQGRIDPFKNHDANDFGDIFNLTAFCICKQPCSYRHIFED